MKDRIVKALRDARDLMNHGGKHWIKGGEKGYVDPDYAPEQGTRFDNPHLSWTPQKGFEAAYCSIGALGEVGADAEAFIELASVIDPNRIQDIRENCIADQRDDWEFSGEKGKFEVDKECLNACLIDWANDIIVDFNDDANTTWADVRSAFTKAARRVSQRVG